MIDGVVFKDLITHSDERGFFREIIRVTDDFFGEGFGQWSHSLMYTGVAKAWHIHKKQVDWWYVAGGVLKVALHDTRPGSSTHGETMELLMGDNQPPRVLRIPLGGCPRLQVHQRAGPPALCDIVHLRPCRRGENPAPGFHDWVRLDRGTRDQVRCHALDRRRILVTGGAGYLATNLLWLLRDTDCHIVRGGPTRRTIRRPVRA